MSTIETAQTEATEGKVTEVVEIIVVEIIDIEICAKERKHPPHARRYRIRIDREYKEVEAFGLTGRQILALVNKTPETHLLSQKIHGGPVQAVGADQFIDFRTPGIERFQTLALDPTEG